MMKRIASITVLLIVFLMLSNAVSAFSLGDIFARINSFIQSLTGGPPTITTTTLGCAPPYIMVGGNCCMDRNGNNICDDDETATTSTTTTTMRIPPTIITTTTIGDGTTTTIRPATTTTLPQDDMVVTPRCGDGYLSHQYTAGGGSEECDPNTGPYNDWAGARRYDCPGNLQCVDCKCVGCGDGRLQSGEQCDPNNVKITVGGKPLWDGRVRECDKSTDTCNSRCVCENICEKNGYYSNSKCDGECGECEVCTRVGGDYDCYYCQKRGCTSDRECGQYHKCAGCECVTDCEGFCAGQGQGYSSVAGAEPLGVRRQQQSQLALVPAN
ncbi:MAG TPA: hypothetical protein ENN13_02360 [Candidatus Altiarchaeales archaeon]|nr:hypothetical protein [Candidatus Altiarchaeales archaeon]